MIKAYNVAVPSGRNLTFYINRNDIVGFFYCDKNKERKIADLLINRYISQNVKIIAPEMKILEIPKDILEKDCNSMTVYKYLREKYRVNINKDYVINGMLELSGLLQDKDCCVGELALRKKYRLEIIGALLQDADLIILHDLFDNGWDEIMETLLIECSIRCAVVVFSEDDKEVMHELPIHYYDLSKC